MTTLQLIVLIAAALAVCAAGIWLYQKRRSERLKKKFGIEYERPVAEAGTRLRAESELEAREKRVEKLPIRPLTPQERARFVEAWLPIQAGFVDDPPKAVAEAERLVEQAMTTRGYPVADFEQRIRDISVDHRDVVEDYRKAHEIMVALHSPNGEASTEDLRQAMCFYRQLFEELLETKVIELGRLRPAA